MPGDPPAEAVGEGDTQAKVSDWSPLVDLVGRVIGHLKVHREKPVGVEDRGLTPPTRPSAGRVGQWGWRAGLSGCPANNPWGLFQTEELGRGRRGEGSA